MMERHPLTFLVVLITIGGLSGVQIGLLILLHRKLPVVRDNTDELIRDRDQRDNHS